MSSKRTIFIIGGGLLQVPIIQTAKTMGLKVLVADMNPDCLGSKLADAFLAMSTKDLEGMVREAKKYSAHSPIHGVITAGTDASMTVAAVASALDLPGIRFVDAEAASNKVKMRKRLKEAGVPIPGFFPVWNIQDARDALDFLKFPLVMKPADNMGARGVIKVENRDELQAAFKHSKKFCPSGELILEEYMSGPEVSVDALAFDGKIKITGIADRIITREPYFIEIGHNMPSALDQSILDKIESVMKQGMKALGINLGAGKGDIKVTPDGVKVGEIAARLSGGFMSAFTYPLSTGVNLNRAAILIALGEKPDNLEPTQKRVSIERALFAKPGKLLEIKGIEASKKILGVNEVFISSNAGDLIKEPTNNIDKSGHVIISGSKLEECELVFEKVKDTIEFVVDDLFSIDEKEMNQKAREKFGRDTCWVCKVCDGTDCASGVPGMGGVGRMLTFQDNSKALAEYAILPSYIRENISASLQTSFLGIPLSSPIMAAPMTGATTNMNGAMSDQEYNEIVLKAFSQNGSIAWIGDGATPNKYLMMLDAIDVVKGHGILICKPREDLGLLRERIQESEKRKIAALGMDIDAVNFKTMISKNLGSVSRTTKELESLRKMTNLPFIIKGVMTVEDAQHALELGASAIVVSNHGGRVLDDMPGTARVLPKIAEAVKGKIPICVDGGIRSGSDVFKMIALGAETVLVGRPVTISAVGGAEAGVKYLLNKYNAELLASMNITGASSLQEINQTMLLKKV